MKNKIDCVIHLCANGVCDDCGRGEENFLPNTCNAHTHGMKKYGHMDFQMMLLTNPEEIARILNSFGLWMSYVEKVV